MTRSACSARGESGARSAPAPAPEDPGARGFAPLPRDEVDGERERLKDASPAAASGRWLSRRPVRGMRDHPVVAPADDERKCRSLLSDATRRCGCCCCFRALLPPVPVPVPVPVLRLGTMVLSLASDRLRARSCGRMGGMSGLAGGRAVMLLDDGCPVGDACGGSNGVLVQFPLTCSRAVAAPSSLAGSVPVPSCCERDALSLPLALPALNRNACSSSSSVVLSGMYPACQSPSESPSRSMCECECE